MTMIGILVKSTVAFCASYILLSFQFGGAYLFEHINNIAGPVGENIQKALGDSFSRSWDKTKEMGGQLINNSDPKQAVQDSVAKTQSAIEKTAKPAFKQVRRSAESYLEELRKEERDSLSKLIESEE